VPTASELDAITPEALGASGQLKWTLFGPGRLGAFVAEMDFGTAPPVTAALHEAVERGLVGYLSPVVAAAMQEACAAWHADAYGWAVQPEQVIALPDVIDGLELTIEHLTPPDSSVILPVPAYMPFFDVPVVHHRRIIPVAMTSARGRAVYDLDALDAAYRAGGHLLILCNPHNPLGRVMEAGELDAIAAVVERHGGRVFADEIHAPLVYPGHRHVPYASRSAVTAGHTLTATSASKAWNLPGLKCAQLIASNEADRVLLEELGSKATRGPSTLGAVANTAAFTAGRPWLNEVLAYLDGNRRALVELLAANLPDVGYTPPEGTYLTWLDCRALGLPVALGDFFLEHADVALVDGARSGAPGAGFVRLNIATSRPILTRIVERMAAAIHAYGA
jgi:cysteine-S-conjugate beta-lyase